MKKDWNQRTLLSTSTNYNCNNLWHKKTNQIQNNLITKLMKSIKILQNDPIFNTKKHQIPSVCNLDHYFYQYLLLKPWFIPFSQIKQRPTEKNSDLLLITTFHSQPWFVLLFSFSCFLGFVSLNLWILVLFGGEYYSLV